MIYFSSGRPIKLVVFNKKFLKFFAKLPRPKYIPCVDTLMITRMPTKKKKTDDGAVQSNNIAPHHSFIIYQIFNIPHKKLMMHVYTYMITHQMIHEKSKKERQRENK